MLLVLLQEGVAVTTVPILRAACGCDCLSSKDTGERKVTKIRIPERYRQRVAPTLCKEREVAHQQRYSTTKNKYIKLFFKKEYE